MKVLFLSSWFPNRVTPYNGDFVERHAIAVSGICPAAVLHVQADHHPEGNDFEVTVKRNRSLLEIIVYVKKYHNKIKSLERIINLIRYGYGYLSAYRILKKEFGSPDIIHANIIFPVAVAAWLWSIITGVPYIISEHWTGYLTGNKLDFPSGWLVRRAVSSAFALTPVTKNLEITLRKHGYTGRFIVVPNVVDTNVFLPGPEPITVEKTRMLHVSSMKEEQKNIMGIIRAVKRLSEIRQDFTMTFIGDFQPRQKALVKDMGLPEEMITFTGEIPHAEVAEAMRRSDMLVMFSNVENLPCVILEAISCGIPVLATDTGGISEWIGESNGMLVQPRNEDGLLAALEFMLDNLKKYNKDDLHRFAVEHFSNEVIAEKFHDIYKEALNLKNN